ncbi:MAG: flavin reductase [Lachnospiraceae bacterium]|nr:flavin reductase [Lachnospiraceae bacterium]
MYISADIQYVGVNDHQVDLFEGQYLVPLGMAYNSYVILDEKIAVMDTVDIRFGEEWLQNIIRALNGKRPDYLIIQHMEPDHSACIMNFQKAYPETQVVSNEKAFQMMDQFFGEGVVSNRKLVDNGDSLSLGKHTLTFVFAPMVHWPEVMVTYDSADKVLFSADGFGKFGANDVVDPAGWVPEARRYYFGIVGKYGDQVQALLKAAATLDIKTICPTHGPVLSENLDYYMGQIAQGGQGMQGVNLAESLGYFLNLYDKWSAYRPEEEGVTIAYTSVYGHTKEAAYTLAYHLQSQGVTNLSIFDLARCDMSEAVESAFRFSKLVLATTTYNAEIYPFMHTFIDNLVERNYQNRTVGLIENGTWAPMAKSVMKGMLRNCKALNFLETEVTIKSALNKDSAAALQRMADELSAGLNGKPMGKEDMSALFRIGYGLYVVTSNDGNKDNGFICNTVTQLTNSPNRVAVNINKNNYSHDVIKATGKCNVNCLSVDAPFSIFQRFGFHTGRDTDKFANFDALHSDNGLAYLPQYINALLSLTVEQYVDLGTHGMFICQISEARVISNKETMTYNYYQKNVKPKPETKGKKGYVCTVCGYVYEGDELPEDFICPICKHGAADFKPIN